MSTKDFTATEDENFFKELDKHSSQFRQDANDMVDSLILLKVKPNEILFLIKALEKIIVIDIKNIDDAINGLTKAFAQLQINMLNNNNFVQELGPEGIKKFFENYQQLQTDANLLVQKAFELQNHS